MSGAFGEEEASILILNAVLWVELIRIHLAVWELKVYNVICPDFKSAFIRCVGYSG